MGFIKEKCLVFSKVKLDKLSVVISNFPTTDREVTRATYVSNLTDVKVF